jgi:hypothetical protein
MRAGSSERPPIAVDLRQDRDLGALLFPDCRANSSTSGS